MRLRWIVILPVLMFVLNVFAQDTIATDILNQVNNVRQEMGFVPLYFNGALQSAAQQHSDDMAQADRLSHVGTDGSQFWERMQDNGYVLSAGAENVLSRGDNSAEGAFQQWYNSEPHRLNMLSADYVEIGIAYARADSGRFYFTMVLGARSDFVTPTLTPTATVTPTNTMIPSTATATATIQLAPTTVPTIQPTNTAIPVQVTATNTVNPQPIVTNTPIPTATEYIPPDIRLEYDENSLVLINVSGGVLNLANLIFESDSGVMASYRWNTEFLSQPLSGFTNGDCLQVWTLDVSYLNTPDDCRYRHAWIAVADDAVFWRNADFFTVRNSENLVGICAIEAGECEVNLSTTAEDITVVNPVTFGEIPDLRLEFPDSSFTLINVSGRSLDLTGLAFRSESGLVTIEEWDNGFLSQPLSNFGDGGCLQAWTVNQSEQSPPERCRIRHAWILVTDSGDFWRNADVFSVERYGNLIASCQISDRFCTLALPDN